MNSELVWKPLAPKEEERVEPFEFSHTDIVVPNALEKNERPFVFGKSTRIEVAETLEANLDEAQVKIEKRGLGERFTHFKNRVFSAKNAEKIKDELNGVKTFLRAIDEPHREENSAKDEEKQIRENLQPGQNVADFLELQIDSNNQKIEKSVYKNAFRSFTKNAPARIIVGAALGALGGPAGMFGKLILSAAGGAFMGEGIAERRAESKALAAFSNVEGLRDEKTGEYDEIKLQEILSHLDKSELAMIAGGLSEVASVKGLKIAKSIAELSADVEINKNSRFSKVQERFSSLPQGQQKLLKCLPILGGVALLAAPFIIPIAGLGIAGLAASGAFLSLASSGIDRVSSGPKSIGKHYSHSRIIIKSIEELEKKISNEKFDKLRGLILEGRSLKEQIPRREINNLTTQHNLEGADSVTDFNRARKDVKDELIKGAALGVLGMEVLQHVAPLLEHKAAELGHGMSSVFDRFTSLFAHGGLPHEPTTYHPDSVSANTAQLKEGVDMSVSQPTTGDGLETKLPDNFLHPEHIENSNTHTLVGAGDQLSFSNHDSLVLPHDSDSFKNVVSSNFMHSGLHLNPLDGGRILHWEGAATAGHPVSSVSSLAHEVIYSVEPTLDKHDQNEAAHTLAQDWIHRGLFHPDGSLVQAGKEHLPTQINAYEEAKAAVRRVITT